MNTKQILEQIAKIKATLCATRIRVDELDSAQRVSACVDALIEIEKELWKNDDNQNKQGDGTQGPMD